MAAGGEYCSCVGFLCRIAPARTGFHTRSRRMKVPALQPLAALRGVGPGVFVSFAIAGAAGLVATWTNGPVMLFALLLGMAMNFLGRIDRFEAGIAFTSKFILRLGVAMLGLKITLGDVASLGWGPLALVFAAVTLTILISVPAAKVMGFDPRFGILGRRRHGDLRRVGRHGPCPRRYPTIPRKSRRRCSRL